jgi:hypothetical protein
MTKQSDELAALKKKVEELEAKVSPPKSDFKPMSVAEWQDQMHEMRERRMSMATPPSVIRDFAVLDDRLVKEIALKDARAPTGPSSQGAIPSSQQVTGVRPGGIPGGGTGWQAPIPLSPPPGVAQADRLMDAQDAKDRAELIEREAKFKATEKLAERKP